MVCLLLNGRLTGSNPVISGLPVTRETILECVLRQLPVTDLLGAHPDYFQMADCTVERRLNVTDAGTWDPMLRLGSNPEIVMLEFK
jgi:hypothetical protein